MGKFDITDQLIKDQQKHIETLDNLINLAKNGTYVTMSTNNVARDIPPPDDARERQAYIESLKAQLKHSEDVLIALQNNFDGADMG